MDERKWERYGAASGFAMVAFGAAAMMFERAPVTATDFTSNRTPLLIQSMLFLAGVPVTLWFIGSLRTYLLRFEGGTGRLATVAFGAGVAWTTLNLAAQAFQVGAASDPKGETPTALIKTMTAFFTIANLPLAVMLVAVAVVSLRYHAFPRWLGWVAVIAAAAQALLWSATVIHSGPLASDGWLSFALYPFFLIWLVPATVIMIKRAGELETTQMDRGPSAARSREMARL